MNIRDAETIMLPFTVIEIGLDCQMALRNLV